MPSAHSKLNECAGCSHIDVKFSPNQVCAPLVLFFTFDLNGIGGGMKMRWDLVSLTPSESREDDAA